MLVFINLGNKAHFLREKRINLLFRSTNNSTNIEIKVKIYQNFFPLLFLVDKYFLFSVTYDLIT